MSLVVINLCDIAWITRFGVLRNQQLFAQKGYLLQ